MLNYPENSEGQFYMYDKIDMNKRWWDGFVAGAVVAVVLCATIGVYF